MFCYRILRMRSYTVRSALPPDVLGDEIVRICIGDREDNRQETPQEPQRKGDCIPAHPKRSNWREYEASNDPKNPLNGSAAVVILFIISTAYNLFHPSLQLLTKVKQQKPTHPEFRHLLPVARW